MSKSCNVCDITCQNHVTYVTSYVKAKLISLKYDVMLLRKSDTLYVCI